MCLHLCPTTIKLGSDFGDKHRHKYPPYRCTHLLTGERPVPIIPPTIFLEWVRKPRKQDVLPPLKPRRSPSPRFHRILPTRFWITSRATQMFEPSELALSYPNHGFDRAGATSSIPSISLRGIWIDGSRRSRCRKRVPLATSGIWASGLEGIIVFPTRSFSIMPYGSRTWSGCACWDMWGTPAVLFNLHYGGYRSL